MFLLCKNYFHSLSKFEFALSEKFFLIFFIAVRLLLSLILTYRYEGDEVVVLYWGLNWIKNSQWHILTEQDFPAWETTAAYLFGIFDYLTNHPRILAFFLGIFECIGLFYLVYLIFDHRLAKIAFFILLSMPYHVFFSHTLGPLNVGWLFVWYLCAESSGQYFFRFLTLFLGLAYYATFRSLVIWKAIFIEKFKIKKMLPELLAIVLFLAMLLVFDVIDIYFKKGSYLLERGIYYTLVQYLQGMFIWIVPGLSQFSFISQFYYNDLGLSFVQIYPWDTPITLIWSVFLLIGIKKGLKESKLKKYIGLLGLFWVSLGWTATLTHFVSIAGLMAIFVAYGVYHTTHFKKWFYLGLLWASLANIFFIIRVYKDYSPLLSPYAQKPIEEALKLANHNPKKIFVYTQSQVFVIRYLADKFHFEWSYLPQDFQKSQFIDYRFHIQKEQDYIVLLAPLEFNHYNQELLTMQNQEIDSWKKYRYHIEYSFNYKKIIPVFDQQGRLLANIYELPNSSK